MTTIQVHDLVGPICIDPDDAVKLYDLAREALDRGDSVCMDFTGVTHLFPPFLDTAVGGLYGCYDKDDLRRRLSWLGLDQIDEDIMESVERRSILFFSATPAQQEALLEASSRYPGE